MFLLKNVTHQDTYSAFFREEAQKAITYANGLLEDSTKGLIFDPEEHKYFLGEKEIPSVSSIVNYYAPFDTEGIALRCSKNPRHEHFGKSVEEILGIWDEKKKEAADAGTQVHAFGEACCLYRQGRMDEIDEEYKDRITTLGFEARIPKEEAAARWWDDLDLYRYVVVAKETRIVNPSLCYAGTFDLLLYDMESKSYLLRDYKTNEDLFKFYGNMLKAPLNMIRANDAGKYTLQQNLYKLQLKNIGINVSDMSLLWLKQDGLYQEVHLQDYDTLIAYAMQNNPTPQMRNN